MRFLQHIKRVELNDNERWIVKYDKKGLVREVKQIYKPSEYYALNKHKGKNARPLHNKNALIKILENDYKKRHDKS
tara:strand:+ start:435 stop:662 length:228 start_codon:yes stop_codon:yes gene_type:complete